MRQQRDRDGDPYAERFTSRHAYVCNGPDCDDQRYDSGSDDLLPDQRKYAGDTVHRTDHGVVDDDGFLTSAQFRVLSLEFHRRLRTTAPPVACLSRWVGGIRTQHLNHREFVAMVQK
jgi:hypothetical protein